MSIASEITRLNNAKTSIKNSIINKGVTVSDTKKIDEYSTLIDSIETKKPEQSKSATPSESVQNITPDNGYTLSQVTVEAISKTYVGSNVTKKSAQTYTPTTTDQIIASDQYLTGIQTIKGDANLTPENIKKDVNIFGVTGTLEDGGNGGKYNITATENNDGTQSLAIVDANGSVSANLQSKSVTYTSNGTATVTPDSGYDGLSSVDVTVNVSGGGGGEGVETCTLTTSFDSEGSHGVIYAYNGDTLIDISSAGTYSINKNSLIVVMMAHPEDVYTGLDNLYYSFVDSTMVCNVISDTATYRFSFV